MFQLWNWYMTVNSKFSSFKPYLMKAYSTMIHLGWEVQCYMQVIYPNGISNGMIMVSNACVLKLANFYAWEKDRKYLSMLKHNSHWFCEIFHWLVWDRCGNDVWVYNLASGLLWRNHDDTIIYFISICHGHRCQPFTQISQHNKNHWNWSWRREIGGGGWNSI